MDQVDRAEERLCVLRWQSGDERGFEHVFRRYHGALTYYLRRTVEPPEEADDVLQSVWLKALGGIRDLHDPRAFRAWLYRIAHNEALQHLRKHGRLVLHSDLDPLVEATVEEDFSNENAEAIHAGLVRLTPAHREVLTLRFLDDLSYDEIASVTGLELGTVRSRIHYAKKALRRLLEEKDNDE